MTNIKTILASSIAFLEKKQIKIPKLSCETLLSYVLNIKKSDLYFSYDKKVSNDDELRFNELIRRRAKNEPIDYIIGQKEFFGCPFDLTEDVLIPRCETEILVEFVKKEIEKDGLKNITVFDVCTGSGCIGISLKKVFKNSNIYLSDISKKALKIAKKNAKENSVNVFFHQGDLLKPLEGLKANYVICNPPYISEREYNCIDEDVKNYEPKLALVARDDGLEFYKRVEKEIYDYLHPKAKLFFEIGYNQKKDVMNIFSSKKWKTKKVFKDFSYKDRFFFVEIE